MKVCDVTQFYSPYGGGVKRYLMEKRRYVRERTSDEHILIIPGATTGYTQEGPLHTYTIKSPPISATSRYRALVNQEAVRACLRHARPDVIESGDPYQVAWTALREARAQGVPTVGFYHSHFPEAYLRTATRFGGPLVRDGVLALARRYVRHLYNHFNYTLVCAQGLRDVLSSWGVENVHPIKLGVDTDAFRPGPATPGLRRRLGFPESSFLLLFVGRLAGEKNIRTLLDAFELLRRTSPTDYRLLCIGQGPWRAQLLDTREATGGALQWLPHLGNSRALADVYRTADLGVHPSLNETFGLVPLEAQASGLPVCGIRGSCLDENAMAGLDLWAAENTPTSLAAAIERMRHSDRRALGLAASARASREYAWPVVLDELWAVYRELVTERPRPDRRRAASAPGRAPDARDFIIRRYQPSDREAVRRICCDTGFLGSPIDPLFADRETFADFLTAYYTDAEPESFFVLEVDGRVQGYLCGCRCYGRRRRFLATHGTRVALRALARALTFRYDATSRRYLRWLVTKGRSETPPRPEATPHFHINILAGARSIPGTKALINAFLDHLRACGETSVYGQMVVFEDRRGEALFTRFGFNILNRCEVTKYREHYSGRVFLCTAYRDLRLEGRLEAASPPAPMTGQRA